MPSPDLSGYVDLSIYDKDAQSVFDIAVEVIKTALPDWIPEEGNTEVVLLEAMAQEVTETIYAINRLPGAITQILLQLYGVNRDSGLQPTAVIHVKLVDTLGHDIPVGTRFLLNYDESREPIVFTTDVGTVIAPTFDIAEIAATGDLFTDNANGVALGTAVELLDAIPYVDYANLGTAVEGGVPEEDDVTWMTRSVARLGRLADTLVIPKHFVAAAIEYPFITRALTLDNFNAPLGTGVPGDHPGHVTVVVYGVNMLLTSPQKVEIDYDFETNSLANLAVHIADPTIVHTDINVTVNKYEGYLNADVIANVTAVLNARLTPSAWDWSTTLYRSDIIGMVASAAGVSRVTAVTTPAVDLALGAIAPLVQVDTITVTVA